MKLTEEVKALIIKENNEFRVRQYGELTKEERKQLGAIYTPGEVVIQMIEKIESIDGNILDPTCGSGNLLAGCLIAGADPYNVYGNEFVPEMVELCRKRLKAVCDMLGKPHIRDWQIHNGNALDPYALKEFSPEYCKAQEEELKKYGVIYTGFKASEEFKKQHKGKKLQEAMTKCGFTN
jgi:SAM-dependent methyltransferase